MVPPLSYINKYVLYTFRTNVMQSWTRWKLSLLLIPAAAAADAPTFASPVASIVFQHCTVCHREGGGAPFALTTYEDVSRRARMIAEVTQSRRMPPWLAERGEVHFRNERGLSDDEIATLRAWAEAGAPLGDAAAVPPAPVYPSEWFHGPPDILLEMEEEMPIPPDGPDIYRNFVVRIPDIPEGKYLEGVDYKPRTQSAHHTLFSLDTTGDMRRAADMEPRPGFAGMEANLISGRIGGWAVGAQPDMFPAGASIKVQPGTDLFINAHFHPVGKPEVERSRIALYLTEEPPTRQMMTVEIPYGFGITANLRIPAGEANYVLKESFTFPADATLTGLAPHAHLLAKDIKAEATFPDGRQLTLIHVPQWDFAWQEQYHFKEPILLPKGTRIDCTFVYDNSAGNPFNPHTPPEQVTWGPNTTDEMACVSLRVVTENPEQLAALKQGYGDWVKDCFTRVDYKLIARSVRAQDRDSEDLNGDGKVSWEESLADIRRLRGVLRHDELGIVPFVIGHLLRTKALPFVLPWLAVLVLIIAALVWWRRRRRRQAAT